MVQPGKSQAYAADMTIAIRELGLADTMMLEELLDALSPGWTDDLAPGASGPMAFLSQPRSFVFGAYADNQPAGWLWGAQNFAPDGRRTSVVYGLSVVEEHRRKGIATALFDAASGMARRDGSGAVQLTITGVNPSGESFCQEAGGVRSETGDAAYSWTLR